MACGVKESPIISNTNNNNVPYFSESIWTKPPSYCVKLADNHQMLHLTTRITHVHIIIIIIPDRLLTIVDFQFISQQIFKLTNKRWRYCIICTVLLFDYSIYTNTINQTQPIAVEINPGPFPLFLLQFYFANSTENINKENNYTPIKQTQVDFELLSNFRAYSKLFNGKLNNLFALLMEMKHAQPPIYRNVRIFTNSRPSGNRFTDMLQSGSTLLLILKMDRRSTFPHGSTAASDAECNMY